MVNYLDEAQMHIKTTQLGVQNSKIGMPEANPNCHMWELFGAAESGSPDQQQ